MAESQNLPVIASIQNLATLAKSRESLAVRGLAAIRNGGLLAKSQDNDTLYRQARGVYEHYYFEYLKNNNWHQSEHANELMKAFSAFRRLATAGYGKAYYSLSRLYKGSEPLKETQALAKHFSDLAFQWCFDNQLQNDPVIWHDLGELYQSYAIDNTPDYALAFFWFKKASEQDYARAQYQLGWSYEAGNGVEKDDESAVYWYERAAEQGYASAQNNLGWMYQNNRGVEQDDEIAVYWYEKSAKQGNAIAQCNLGCM